MANAEQLGANRHVAGNPGASTRRYVLSPPAQADRLRVAVRGGHGSPGLLRRNRDRQAPAPLVAPPLQDAAPAGRSHPGAEAMRSFAAAVARLIGPLHRSPGWAREPAIRTQRSGNVNFTATKALASSDRLTPLALSK